MIKRDRTGRFKKGCSGNPNGVPKGLKQKSTDIKEAFYDAFEQTGGLEELKNWINENEANRKEFYSFLLRILPKEIEADIKGEFKADLIYPQEQIIFTDAVIEEEKEKE